MLTNFPQGISSFGVPVFGSVPATFGNVWFVDYGAGSDGNDGKSTTTALKTLSAAYALAVSNNDDMILVRGNSTVVDSPILWAKNRIHVIGIDGAPGRMLQQGAKISSTTAGATSYVLKVTGVRNSFVNLKFIQNSAVATALTVLEEGGEGSYYQGCSFVFGVADNLDLTTAHEVLAGSDSATFVGCTFGLDTLLTSAARSVFHIDQVNGFEFKSNQIIDCTFSISSSSATATFVRLDGVGDILFSNLFKRCTFLASVDSAGGAAIAEATQTGTSTVKGCLAYDQCSFFNCTDVTTATSGRNAATQIVAVSPTAGTAGVGVQPTA